MATPTINATALTPIVARAITSDYQATIYDQSGNAGRAAVADVVSAAQTINGCLCVKYFDTLVPTADVKQINTTPFQILPAPPAGFEYSFRNIYMSAVYAGVPYDTFTQMELMTVGAGSASVTMSEDLLGFSADVPSMRLPLGDFTVSKTNATGAIFLTNSTGNPATGTSDIRIRGEYALIPV